MYRTIAPDAAISDGRLLLQGKAFEPSAIALVGRAGQSDASASRSAIPAMSVGLVLCTVSAPAFMGCGIAQCDAATSLFLLLPLLLGGALLFWGLARGVGSFGPQLIVLVRLRNEEGWQEAYVAADANDAAKVYDAIRALIETETNAPAG